MSALLLLVLAQVGAGVPTSKPMLARPFQVGETFQYKGRLSIGPIPLPAGGTTLSVIGIDTTRGVETWKFSMVTDIRNKLKTLHQELTSWTGTSDFVSRRFYKFTSDSGSRLGTEDFYIFPDSGYFRRHPDGALKPTPKDALDDLSFLYYVRMIPLKVGDTVIIPRYYRQDVRSLEVRVTGRETCELPDKSKVACLVMNPIVEQKNGLFRAEAKAKLWLTDDARRIPVRIEGSLSVGRVRLELEKMTLPGRKP